MRVPIYPDDLNPSHGFKRIAKKPQREWPGFNPIQLSFAREILSKGLGYRDYHDVVQSSKKWQPETFPFSKEEVNVALMSAISAAIQIDNKLVKAHPNLLALVQSLPLHTLVALKGDQMDNTDDYPNHETLSALSKRRFDFALVANEFGYCSNTFYYKHNKSLKSCGICPYYIIPIGAHHMDLPTSP